MGERDHRVKQQKKVKIHPDDAIIALAMVFHLAL
jgi:hypothetical protein